MKDKSDFSLMPLAALASLAAPVTILKYSTIRVAIGNFGASQCHAWDMHTGRTATNTKPVFIVTFFNLDQVYDITLQKSYHYKHKGLTTIKACS